MFAAMIEFDEPNSAQGVAILVPTDDLSSAR